MINSLAHWIDRNFTWLMGFVAGVMFGAFLLDTLKSCPGIGG